MKWIWGALAFGFIGIAAVRADESPIEATVVVDTSKDTSSVQDAKYGDGQEQVKTPSYSVKLHNKGMDPIPNVGVKLFVVGAQNWIEKAEGKKVVAVTKVLAKKDIPIEAAGDAQVDLGEVEFKSKITAKTENGITTNWYSGQVYEGYVLEIYINDALVDVKVGGPSTTRRAYDDYLKKAPQQ